MYSGTPTMSPVDALSRVRFENVSILGHEYRAMVVLDLKRFGRPPSSVVIPVVGQNYGLVLVLKEWLDSDDGGEDVRCRLGLISG